MQKKKKIESVILKKATRPDNFFMGKTNKKTRTLLHYEHVDVFRFHIK